MTKKIAFITNDLSIGGIEKAFISYANILVKCYNISFIVVHKRGTLLNELSKKIKVHELKGRRLRYTFVSLVKLIRREKFDYIISGTEQASILSVIANMIVGDISRIITSQHNYDDIECKSIIHKYLLPWILKKSYFTFAVSSGISQMLRKMGISENKLEVLYNPIATNEIRLKADQPINNLPRRYLLFVGRFYPVKNIPLLLKAFQIFSRNNPDFSLVMVGDGALFDDLHILSKKLKINDKIIWTGAITNPYPYIKNAELVLISSFSESLSIVVLESICLGKTVVSTPCKGPEEILHAPKYGYTTDSLVNEYNYADKIEYAIRNKINPKILYNYSESFKAEVSVSKLINIIERYCQ